MLVPIALGNLKNEAVIRLQVFLRPSATMLFAPHSARIFRLRNLLESYLLNVFHLVRELTELTSGQRFLGIQSPSRERIPASS